MAKAEKKEVKPGADLSGLIEQIKGLHFEDRGKLVKVVDEAHKKDLDKASYGGDPDGELYVAPEPVKEEKKP